MSHQPLLFDLSEATFPNDSQAVIKDLFKLPSSLVLSTSKSQTHDLALALQQQAILNKQPNFIIPPSTDIQELIKDTQIRAPG